MTVARSMTLASAWAKSSRARPMWKPMLSWTTVMGPTGSTYPDDLVEETVELFGTKVIPEFDTSPDEARAARFRRQAAEKLGLS